MTFDIFWWEGCFWSVIKQTDVSSKQTHLRQFKQTCTTFIVARILSFFLSSHFTFKKFISEQNKTKSWKQHFFYLFGSVFFMFWTNWNNHLLHVYWVSPVKRRALVVTDISRTNLHMYRYDSFTVFFVYKQSLLWRLSGNLHNSF